MPLKRFGSGASKTVSSNLHKFHKVIEWQTGTFEAKNYEKEE